jgi:hypothetical protein
MEDHQFELLGVVPGDVGGAVKEVTLRMTRAAEEDPSFREMLAQLAAERGGMYAEAMMDLNKGASPTKEREHVTRLLALRDGARRRAHR